MGEQHEKRRPRPLTWFVLALVVSVPLVAAWELLLPHMYITHTPRTLWQAQRHSPISLPSSAHDIYIATYRHFQEYIEYVRFEAPLSDCEAHAKLLTEDGVHRHVTVEDLQSSQVFNPRNVFDDLSWFDVQNIRDGEEWGAEGPSSLHICIDRERGIFYYAMTD